MTPTTHRQASGACRWWWYVAPVLLAGVALAGAWLSAGHRPPTSATSGTIARPVGAEGSDGVRRLSAQAQSVISSRVGASSTRFAPRRSRGGVGLAGGGVAAALGRGGVSIDSDGARLSLGLLAVGRGGRLGDLAEVDPRVHSHRVVYARGAGVLEWYTAGPLGIEQGFTLARRPAGGSGAVTMALALGGVRARLAGSGVEFLTQSGRVALRYGGLVARDARGRRLPAWLSLSRSRLRLEVADRGARYPLLIDPFIQQGAKLTADDESGKGSFGEAVAVSADGNTALIGGSDDNNQKGAAWVFTRSQGAWTQQGPKLTASDESGPGWFGSSVALSADGNTALIGGTNDGLSGAAWVFTRSGSTWTQQGSKLTAADQVSFGTSVALSSDGNTALIGAPDDNNNAGTAWVFTRSGSAWSQQGSPLAGGNESGQGNFGLSVALSGDGNTALIGGFADNNLIGAAWAFARSGSTWTQQGPKLTASDESGEGGFGGAVALSGDGRTALIGGNDDGAAGAAWVFTRGFPAWTQHGPKLTAGDASAQADFGFSVALSNDGQTALIGGEGDNDVVGSAWMFAVNTWTQQGPKLTAADESGGGNFGTSVALSADASTALVGGPADNGGIGAAWAFAAKNQAVYWDNPQAGTIGVDTGPSSQINQSFISGLAATHATAVATDGQYLYWPAGSAIARANLDGSDVNLHFIPVDGFPVSIAVDGQYLYWITSQGIGRANLDGSGVQNPFITVTGGFLTGLAVDSGHIYWKDARQQSIGRANLDGTGIDDKFIAGAGAGGRVAVNAQNIYWTYVTGSSAPFVGAIGRANIDGTGVAPRFITGVDDPEGLAVDDNFIYWASNYTCNYQTDPPTSCGGGTIGRATLDGSGVNYNFVTADPQVGTGCGTSPETRCGPTAVAVATLPDGTAALYWDNPQVGAIGRETIDGNPGNVNQSLVTGIRQLDRLGVAVDLQHLYWTDGGSIGRSNLDGTGADQQFIQLGQAATYVAVDDQHIYWSNPGGIGRANLDGNDVTTGFISLPGDNVGGLAVDSLHIYWADRTHGTIGRANLDGTGVTPSFITGATNVTDVAIDPQHIYWTQIATSGLPPGGSIGRANLDGTGANSSFITGAAEPWGITVDYAHIYWANYYFCDYHTQPPSACAGGTIGRANLDGSAANQAYITADQTAGPGCGTSPETRCGPSTVAVSAPTQPICMRTPLTPTPVPPPGGAIFARPLDPASSDANVVVLPAGTSWTGDASCLGVAQGSAQVMTNPASISVSPDSALLLHDKSAGLVSAWGAQNVGAGGPAPVLFPGRSDWQTSEVDVVAPQQLLDSYGGCPVCELPNDLEFTPGQSSADVAYQGDVSDASMVGATLTGSFDGWDFSGAQLGGASVTGASVSGANFAGADLRGAQLSSLLSVAPPSFANVRVGALGGACTVFKDTNLVGTGFTPVQPDLLVPGCQKTPLLPGSTAPLDLIYLLAHTDAATVDFANAQFQVTAANRAVLAGVDLHGIDLAGASFVGFPADFESTIFNGASLASTSFQLADLAGAQFQGAQAPGASFEDADLTNQASFAGATTDLEGADFIQADVSSASFQNADLGGASFDRALAVGTDFNSVLAGNAKFNGAHIYGDGEAFDNARELTGADFVNAVLAGSEDGTGGFDLNNADLTGANFDGAQCIACNFTGSTLTGATFTGADLPGAQLSGVNSLQNASFDNAWLYCGDLSDDSCKTSEQPPTLQWPLSLGSQEDYGPVPFTSTTLDAGQWTDVRICPDANPPSATTGCQGQLLPGGTITVPGACSAAALDACVTPTSTLFDASTVLGGSPVAVVPVVPPTWASSLQGKGYDVALSDGTVRLVGAGGPARVVAGRHNAHCPAPTQPCGDGGPATQGLLGAPNALAVGLDGSLYMADPALHRVRRIDPSGTISTVAGSGQACTDPSAACGDGGPAIAAALSGPEGVWSSPSGELLIADGKRGIREVLPNGNITTIPTGPAGTNDFVSVTGDATGNLYAATNNPDYLIQIAPTSGKTTTVVGTGTSGYNGNSDPNSGTLLPGPQVQINHPEGLSVALNGDVVFADTNNHLIRAFVPSSDDPSNGHVIDDLGGLITKGVPQGGFNGDGLDADQTKLENPAAVTVTRGALLVIADTGNARVRQIGPSPLASQLGHPGPLPPPVGGGPPTGPIPPAVQPGQPAASPPGGGGRQHPPVKPPAHRHRHRPRPNNHFAVSHLKVDHDGTITFAVTVHGPGRIDVLATAWNNNLVRSAVALLPARHRFAFARSHRRARRATTLHLRVTPNRRGKQLLDHHTYRIVLRLWVTYTPTRGAPRSAGFYGLHLPRRASRSAGRHRTVQPDRADQRRPLNQADHRPRRRQ